MEHIATISSGVGSVSQEHKLQSDMVKLIRKLGILDPKIHIVESLV